MNETSILQTSVMVVSAIILLGMMYAVVKIMNGANTLEWTDLVSTRAHDGTQHADWNKIGQGMGVVLSAWLPAVYAYSPHVDATGLAALLGVALAYLGGVSAYAATLRAKAGTVETTKVTEPVPPAPKVTDTITQTAPIAEEAKPKRGKK